MRTEKEIEELKSELAQIVDYIVDSGTEKESEHEDVEFALDVLDVLDWVLGEIETEDFKVDPYLNMAKLEEIFETVESRTEEESAGDE